MANSPALHAVIFRIGEVVCAAPAGIVREILPRLPATRIPGVPDAVEGLVNVRGSLLTVLDGHLLLLDVDAVFAPIIGG
jgi:chemotaxis signal transduction protein